MNTNSNITYKEIDSTELVREIQFQAVGAICFYNEKMVLVFNRSTNVWEMPGGMIEAQESLEEAITREIKEESNMRVTQLVALGYERSIDEESGETIYRFRFGCRVEPLEEFAPDPDGEITKIKLINPEDYKKYFDWGERSDRMVAKAKNLLL